MPLTARSSENSSARQLLEEIERFRGQVSGLREPLASEFRAAALAWKQVAERQLAQVRTAVLQEPVRQVFRAGDPVNRGQEAFIPRVNVIGKLEQQVMLATGCPGVILYGRRRRGKSSALRNLTGLGLLPVSVHAATVSMQEPRAFSSVAAFAGRVAQEIPSESPPGTPPETLPELFDLLSRANQQLASGKERLILALDEYENIDSKIGEESSRRTCWPRFASRSRRTGTSPGCSPGATTSKSFRTRPGLRI